MKSNGEGGSEIFEKADDSDDEACPPGIFPRKETEEETDIKDDAKFENIQSDSYPGPFIGGTLKQFPPSARPPCPEGYIELPFLKDEGESICVPKNICTDFNDVREKLFGPDWEGDEVTFETASMIEAFFCLDIIEHNRPESPYELNEGCVDCHIAAIVDSIDKALQTNVTPLQNTMTAFGQSNRWGPNFNLDLNTMIKSSLKFHYVDPGGDPTEETENAIESDVHKNKANEKESPTASETPIEKSNRLVDEKEKNDKAREEAQRNYGKASSIISDQEVGYRVIPLLVQMRERFKNIHGNVQAIANLKLGDKLACK